MMKTLRPYLTATLALGLGFFYGCAAAKPRECSRIHLIADPEVEESVKTYLGTAWDITKTVAEKTRSLLEKGYARYYEGKD